MYVVNFVLEFDKLYTKIAGTTIKKCLEEMHVQEFGMVMLKCIYTNMYIVHTQRTTTIILWWRKCVEG